MVTILLVVFAVLLGVVIGVIFGGKITAEIKTGFALLAQTIHERFASLEAAIKSKV